MQAILLTTSLLLVAGMLASLGWLAAVRSRGDAVAVTVETADDLP
jgi:hypothetical protein